MTVALVVLAWVLGVLAVVLAAVVVRRTRTGPERAGIVALAVLALVVAGVATYTETAGEDDYSQDELRSLAFDVANELEAAADGDSFPLIDDVEQAVDRAGGDPERVTVLRVTDPSLTTPDTRYQLVSGAEARACVLVRPSSTGQGFLASVPGDLC